MSLYCISSRDRLMSPSVERTEQHCSKRNGNVGLSITNGAKLDRIKEQTRAWPLIRQFKLTALGLNEALHALGCLIRIMARREMSSRRRVKEEVEMSRVKGRVGGDGGSGEMWKVEKRRTDDICDANPHTHVLPVNLRRFLTP